MSDDIPERIFRRCATPECGARARASGYCHRCYQRLWRQKGNNGPDRKVHTSLTVHQIQQAKRMHSAFKTLAEIADTLGVSQPTIKRALKPGYRPKLEKEPHP